MKIDKKNIVMLGVLFIMVLVVYNKWFFNHGIMSFGDWYFFYKESLIDVRLAYFSTWISDFSFGRVVLDLGQAPSYSLYGLLAKYLNLDYAWSERLVHLWPIALLTPLSSYILLKSIFKNYIAIFIGVLVYTFNTYFLVLQIGHLTLMAAFSLVPLALYFYQQALQRLNITRSVITGLIFFVISAYEPRIAYIIFWLLFLYAVYFIPFQGRKYLKRNIIKIGICAFIPFLLVGLLNIYWILGLANIGVITSNELFDRSLYGGNLFNILYGVTIYHPFWTGSAVEIFATKQIIPYFWLFPFLAIIGLIFGKKNKIVLFFGIVALFGIFLSKQEDIPFSDVYSWLYYHFPGFNAFREASKFFFLTALGYSILITSFFSWLWENQGEDRWKTIAKYFVTTLTIVLLLWNAKPLITGEVGRVFIPRKIPADFIQAKNFIVKQNTYFRTLWIPAYTRWSVFTSLHPEISMLNVVNSEWADYVEEITPKNSESVNIIKFFQDDNFNNLLDMASIKYVIVSLRVKDNEEDWIGPATNRDDYIRTLDNIPYLKRVNSNTGGAIFYENEAYRPHIYSTVETELTKNNVVIKEVNYLATSSTEYKVELENITQPLYLQFSEAYHQSWKIAIGDFSWAKELLDRNNTQPNTIHTKNVAGFNTFYIDPRQICKDEGRCIRNEDGSYTIDATIFFKPQSYLYLGVIISITTLVMTLGYLILYILKYAKNKKK